MMPKRTIAKTASFLGTALLLCACPADSDREPAVSKEVRELADCRHPAVLPDIRDNLRQTMRREAQRLAEQDKRRFVDADKVTAAADRLQVRMQSVQADSKLCTAQISVIIPQAVLDTAERYAPILESAGPAEIILNRTANNNLRFDGQAVMAQLDYRVNPDNRHFAVNYSDGNLSLLGNVLTAALLSYGVKDIIMVNGKAVNRDAALRNMDFPKVQAVIRPHEVETLQPPPPAAVPAAPRVSDDAAPVETAPPPPVAEEEPVSRISESRLQQARSDHENADRDIKNAWHNIDPQVQQNLMEDQRAWEDRKNSSCRKSAARGADESESQFLHIQCDIRETRKRIKELNEYSIR